MFQSSVPPKRDCSDPLRKRLLELQGVSILSPSEEGLQRHSHNLAARQERVSILSPSEEGLQRTKRWINDNVSAAFQSSVPPKRDCNFPPPSRRRPTRSFQSSVPPKRDCNVPLTSTSDACRGFNPQSLRRGTATLSGLPRHHLVDVSILSPSEEGLQHARDERPAGPRGVSILSPSEEGLQPAPVATTTPPPKFQSSVPPKRDCNIRGPLDGEPRYCFNPQSLRRGTATPAQPHAGGVLGGVSILSPSEEGLQRSAWRE